MEILFGICVFIGDIQVNRLYGYNNVVTFIVDLHFDMSKARLSCLRVLIARDFL